MTVAATTTGGPAQGERRAPGRGPLLAVLSLTGAAMALIQTLAVPLLPALPGELGIDIAAASWVASVTLVVGAVSSPIIGRLGDAHGKRRVILWCLALAGAGCVVAALAPSLPLLLAGRAVQGAGVGIIPVALALLRDELAPEGLARGVAVLGGVGVSVGAGLGPMAMSALLDTWGWRSVFWVTAAAIAVAAACVARHVPVAPARGAGGFDAPGALLLSAAVVALLLALTRGASWGWASPAVLGLVAAATVAGVAWVAWERRSPVPLVDLTVSRQPVVVAAHVAGAALGAMVFVQAVTTFALVALPRADGYGFGRSAVVAGLTQVPGSLSILAVSPLAARLARRRGPAALLATGGVTMGAGFALAAVALGDLALVTAGVTTVFLGNGMVFSALALALMGSVPAGQTGAVNAVNSLTRVIGSALAAATVAALLASAASGGDGRPARWGYVAAYGVGVALALTCVVAACWLRGPGRQGTEGSQ